MAWVWVGWVWAVWAWANKMRSDFFPASLNWQKQKAFLIVFLGGINLILIQWVLVREVTTVLLGTELVILLSSVSYFLGISLGYALSSRLGKRWLPLWAVITLILHLSLPILFRVLVSGLALMGSYWAAFLILPLLTPFCVSAFYSIFLPLFADSGEGELGWLYLIELLGSIVGVGVLVFLSDFGIVTIYSIYTVSLLLLLLALGMRRILLGSLALASFLWLIFFPSLNKWSNEFWYISLLGFPEDTEVIFSGYSPYQKVDVLQFPDGHRALYLDGLAHFDGSFGIRLNITLGEIPSDLLNPETALVIGAGVMQTEQLIASTGARVTTVELDPMVASVGENYFLRYNQMDTLGNREVYVDDAKHFIATGSEQYDLIVGDTPAAFSIQPATLYSVPFYQAIELRLTEGGVFVGNMTSYFVPGDTISRRVAASFLEVFDEVMVVTPASVGWSFAFAADDLPFTRAELDAALRLNGEVQFSIFDTEAVRAIVGDAEPITLDSMDLVLQTSYEWIYDRVFYWGGEE